MLKKLLVGIGTCLFVAICLQCGNCTAEEDEMLAGGWSAYKALDSDAKKVFGQATKDIVGVKYTPFCVSEQVVAGTNYCFLCLGVTVAKEPVKKNAYIEVFVDFDGKMGKPEIKKVPHEQKPGGYTIFDNLTNDDRKLLESVQVLGYTYTPFCVAKQPGVKGGKPKYFCEGKPSTAEPEPESVFVTLVQDGGKAKIVDRDKVKWKDFPYVLGPK